MVDLARAFSEIKSLPDHALQRELSHPTGMVPGWLALGEIHERKRMRASTGGGDPSKRKSMAEEYSGSIQPVFAGAGMQPPPSPPPQQPMPPQAQGLGSLPQQAQGYANGGIVSLARGGVVYANEKATRNRPLTPELFGSLEQAVADVYGPGYSMQVYSGGQPESGPGRTGTHRHDLGRAADVYVVDPNGNRLSGDALAPIAQYWQAKKIGGTGLEMHGGGIHLDQLSPEQSGGGWSWDYGGLTQAQKAALEAGQRGELPSLYGGGGGGGGGGLANYQRALLDTIAGPESGGKYNVMYGGSTFSDYSQHPGLGHVINTGPNAGQTSSAAGRYQFLAPTWNEQAQKYGYKDFSPETQDTAAWNYANDVYKAKTGSDLATVLQSGDTKQIANVGNVLSGTWTSLPGGIEQGTTTDKFVSAYQTALGSPSTPGISAQGAVAEAATDAGAKMATAENATAGDPMSQYMVATQLMGKGTKPQAAPPPAAPVRQAVAIDPNQFAGVRHGYLEQQRRSRYG
jgi:muramidase (phage lysozyme)